MGGSNHYRKYYNNFSIGAIAGVLYLEVVLWWEGAGWRD